MSESSKLNIDDLIVRLYTKDLENDKSKTVYDLFEWQEVDVSIKDYKTGKIIYEQSKLEFPKGYSQNACDIIASKYFKRARVPNDRGCEYSLRQVVDRIVRFWTEAALDEKLLTDETSKIFYDEVAYMMLSQRFAPNSPQWFNTGLKYYNTGEEPDGHYFFDVTDGTVKQSQDKYSRTQASACFILGIDDKLLGNKSISEQFVTETRLFKHGSGTGTNFSTLRAKGEKLSGGGTSSGLMSFLRSLDRNAGAIKSGGTTRRAAKMVCIDVDHPEIMDFITWKAKEEDKVTALGKMGYDTDFDGEAYDTVSGQNSNNSIRFSDEFMAKVKNLSVNPNEEIELKGRIDNKINTKVKVKNIWDAFNQSAWRCADPAPQFDDVFNAWHTCPAGEDGKLWAKHNRLNSTNPCGEYAFLDDTACNLASINVLKFYDTNTKTFDVEAYKHSVLLGQIVLEATVHWGQFPIAEVARKTELFRTTGLGIANTASLHLLMGHPYDSDEARAVATAIMSLTTGYSYYTSSLMAAKLGPFKMFELNKPYMLEVMRNHARVSGARNDKYERLNYRPVKLNHSIVHKLGMSELSAAVKNAWLEALELGEVFGYRNAQVTVIAPTGTIAFAMGCEATSIEPFFAHTIWKKLVGGGGMSIVNPLIPLALKNLGYKEEDIDAITKKILDGDIESCEQLRLEHLAIFDTANKCGRGQRFIEPMGHVKMMAALTPMVSGSISKTVNLPKESTVQDMGAIFIASHDLGIKGITVYRDGCKATQPLNTTIEDAVEKEVKFEDMQYKDLVQIAYKLKKKVESPVRLKPFGIRNARQHQASLDGLKLLISVSYYDDGRMAELYVVADKEGSLIKGLLDSLSKQISKMLQYNLPVQDIIKSLKGQKYEPHGFVTDHPYIKYADSISDLIAKILEIEIGDYSGCQVKPEGYADVTHKTYATAKIAKAIIENTISEPAGEKVYGKTCPSCGSTHMRKNGTCYVCESCGSTTGCS